MKGHSIISMQSLARIPWRKIGIRVLWALAIAYVGYLLVFNLTSRLLRNGVGTTEVVRVSYSSAWSWYPGQLQAHDVRIVGADSHIQWQLDIETVRFRTTLWELSKKRFHAYGIRAEGATMRIRQTLAPADITPETLEHLPNIAGVADPPRKPLVPIPPLSDAEYNLWSVRLDDVVAKDVTGIWFNEIRFNGHANIVGSFELQPMRRAWVGPATIDYGGGELRAGSELMFERCSGHVDLTITPFDPRELLDVRELKETRHLSQYVSGGAVIDGRLTNLRFINRYFLGADAPKWEDGAGTTFADVRFVRGVLQAPGRVVIESELARVTTEDFVALGSARVNLVVDESDGVAGRPGPTEAQLAIDVTRFDVYRPGAKAPFLRGAPVAVRARSQKLDLVDPLTDATGSAVISGAELPDLRMLNEYLGDRLVRNGTARASGLFTFSVPEERASGNLSLNTDNLMSHFGGADVRAKAIAKIAIGDFNWKTQRAVLSKTRFEVQSATFSDSPNEPLWWGQLDLESASLSLGKIPTFQTDFKFHAKDGRPILRQIVPVWLAHHVSFDSMHGAGSLKVTPSLISAVGLHAQGGRWDFYGEFEKGGRNNTGVGMARSGAFTVGFEIVDGKTSTNLYGEDWFRRALDSRDAAGRTTTPKIAAPKTAPKTPSQKGSTPRAAPNVVTNPPHT